MGNHRLKKWIRLGVCLLLFMAAAVLILVKVNVDETVERMHPVVSVEKDYPSPEEYKVADELLSAYLRGGNRYHQMRFAKMLEDKDDILTMEATFDLHLLEEEREERREWGILGGDGVMHCEWVLTARRLNEGQEMPEDGANGLIKGIRYELLDVRYLGDVLAGEGKSRKELGIPLQQVLTADCYYRTQGDEVSVTWDGGQTWAKLPVGLEALTTRGEKVDDRSKLQPGSYYISPERLAFVYGGSTSLPCTLLYSDDQGVTWSVTELDVYTEDLRQWVRACYVDFAPDGTGVIAIGAWRERNSESAQIFRSTDGGQTWEKQNPPEQYSGLVRGIGFASSEVGFLVKGESLYRTEDGGKTWEEQDVFHNPQYPQPQAPVFTDEKNGTIIVNQGPNGDLGDGSHVMQYTTSDAGKTWTFDQQVILEKPPQW